MSFFEFLEMIISELVPAGLIITVIPSFIVFCLMKMWKIVTDIFKFNQVSTLRSLHKYKRKEVKDYERSFYACGRG